MSMVLEHEKELPTGWVEIFLENILTKISNGTTENQSKEKTDFPVSRIETISNETIDYDKVRFLKNPSTEIIDKYKIKKGDILFSNINSDSHLGKTAIFFDDRQLLHGINLLLIKPNSEIIYPKFLNFTFNYFRKAGFFYSIAQHAVNQSSINQTKLKQMLISLPPLNEQKRIVDKIEELFCLIDGIVENLIKIKKQIIQYRHSFYTTIFSSLEMIPLESCCDLIAGQHIQKNDYNISKNGMPYLTGPADFTEKYPIISKWTIHPKAMAKKDDILITVKGAGIGKTNILNIDEACISRQLMAVRPHNLSSHFVYSYFKSKFDDFQKIGQSTTVPGISKIQILNFSLPQINPNVQQEIINDLESTQSTILNFIQFSENLLKSCSSLKKSILKLAIEGKLIPQDPNDEPAETLLRKIKQEKEQLIQKQKAPRSKKNVQ